MTDFERAERADRWLAAVSDWIYDRTHAIGIDAWNFDPAQRESRERACRLLARAVSRREQEIVRLNTERAHHRARVRS